jgi:hypothetical protein
MGCQAGQDLAYAKVIKILGSSWRDFLTTQSATVEYFTDKTAVLQVF